MHMQFLDSLAAVGRVDEAGLQVVEEVDAKWKELTWRCDWRWQQLGTAALSAARRELENVVVPCAYSHGDFTPWNTLARDGKLCVFDWESCEPKVPVGWDAFHFSMQVAGLHKKDWRTKFDLATAPGARGLFLLYLLSSLGKSLDERTEANADLDYLWQALINELP